VLLADDHEPVLAELRITLAQEFEIVAGVRNGPDIMAEVERLDPDVLVTDISMPLVNGIEVVLRLRSINPRTKVVFLAVHEDQPFIDAAFSTGACAYVIKADATTDLIPAIRECLKGPNTFPTRSRDTPEGSNCRLEEDERVVKCSAYLTDSR